MKNFKYHRMEKAAMMFLVKAAGNRQIPITVEIESHYSYDDVTITMRSTTSDYWTRTFIEIYQIMEFIKMHDKIDSHHVLWLESFLDTMRVEPPLYGHEDEYKECEEIVTCIIADSVCRNYLKKSDGIDVLTKIKVSSESSLLFMKETESIPDDDPKDVLKL